MKVAGVQMTSGPDVAANLAMAGDLLREAAGQGATLAVLPENFAFMGLRDTDKHDIAEDDIAEGGGGGPIQEFLAQQSHELDLWIVGGTMPLRTQRPHDAPPRVAAACLVHAAGGVRVARYDKIHLFDVDLPGSRETYRESANTCPGAAPMVVETPAGRLGLSVCYDIRFPELYRILGALGAEFFAVPAAFTVPTGQAHWDTLLRARAIENLCYVVAAAQVGRHPGGRETFGHSMIVDHWGRVLDVLPSGTGCVVAEIDLAGQQAARRSFPALQHRKL